MMYYAAILAPDPSEETLVLRKFSSCMGLAKKVLLYTDRHGSSV